jgi:hypothetical protein
MSAADIANEVAALVRDRMLATEDLGDLLASTAISNDNVLSALLERRATRSFRVEQPSMTPLTAALRTEAMDAVPELVARLDTLDRAGVPTVDAASAPVLGRHFAERLAEIGARRPAIAQIVVTLRGHPRASLAATNEETLVARSALASTDSLERANALAVLAGAVALRPYNQEIPWFVGSRAPDFADLSAEFGLGSVTFARSVPNEWRPYYLRELRDGLRDMQEVFPALSVVGLNVAFGAGGLPDSALAMHDPRSRTLQLTVNTSSGTLAHELAHDLDWQTSRRMFARAGGYSTDRAMREQRGALASSVRALAEARSTHAVPGSGSSASIPDRPAEIFARGVDWFVASSLALRGRTNGFLSAVQDASLPGYAAGSPTAVGTAAAGSLISAIDQMTYMSDSIQAGFERTWSDASSIDPVLMVRRVLSTPVPRLASQTAGLGAMLPALAPSLCIADRTPEARARERVALLTIEARARGIVARRARYRFPGARSDWANGLLGVAPWSRERADGMVAAMEGALAAELRRTSADQGVIDAVPWTFRSNDEGCVTLAR